MASSLDYAKYICEQISGAGEITYKKMFGEYGVYCDQKIIGLICDNQFFVKKTVAGANLLPKCTEAPPYKGAKPYMLIEDVEDRDLMQEFICETCRELPIPKPKKPKNPPIK